MISSWVIIEDDRDVVDAIFDKELENIYDMSEIYIEVYYYYCEKEDISLKDQKYTHIEAMKAMDMMRFFMI